MKSEDIAKRLDLHKRVFYRRIREYKEELIERGLLVVRETKAGARGTAYEYPDIEGLIRFFRGMGLNKRKPISRRGARIMDREKEP